MVNGAMKQINITHASCFVLNELFFVERVQFISVHNYEFILLMNLFAIRKHLALFVFFLLFKQKVAECKSNCS